MKMKMKKTILAAIIALMPMAAGADNNEIPCIEPDGTYMFARRDTCDLYMDIYYPEDGSETIYNGQRKPAILFVFGGGFIGGSRDEPYNLPWYKALTENGYTVIAIDYRLGLKGAESVGIGQVDVLDKAIHMAVEDLFSATAFIAENADALNVAPDKLVLCGSSAGAITILQAEYELCNRTHYAAELPEGFRYAGLMSFAGGILSRQGKLKFGREAPPIMLLHGTEDKLVNYKQVAFFNLGFYGSHRIAERLEKSGSVYCIFRYPGHGHEIASIMGQTVPMQDAFIKENVIDGKRTVIDATVNSPGIPSGKGMSQSRKELYGN